MLEGGKDHSNAFDVIASDIDHMGHVNNTVYLRWIQDAVTAFWIRNAPNRVIHSIAWVALRHDIAYHRPAFLHERVDVQMSIERISGARAFFDATIRRGETVLAKVKSVWCSVDVTSLRAVRLERDVRAVFLCGPEATA